MQFSGVTFEQLEEIAAEISVRVEHTRRDRRGCTGAVLRPILTGEYRRRFRYSTPAWGATKRLVNAVCWHGHAHFLHEFFTRFQDESVRTSFGGQTYIVVADDHGHDKHDGEFELEDWLAFSSDISVSGGLNPNQLCACGDDDSHAGYW